VKATDYIKNRKATDIKFAENYDTGFTDFKVMYALKAARLEAGLTQEELAEKIGTKRSAISRMEKHATDIKLSTLEKIATALGKKISIQFS